MLLSKKRLVMAWFFAAFISLLIILPSKAFAATGVVIDRSTIKVGDQVFFDGDMDDNFKYEEKDPKDGCGDYINGFSNNADFDPGKTPTDATLVVNSPAGAGSSKCISKDESITFSARDNFLKAFAWNDTNTIGATDGKLTFTRYKNSKDFVSKKDKGAGCFDTLTINGDNTTAVLIARYGGGSNEYNVRNSFVGYQDDYDWYPFERPTQQNRTDWKWNDSTKCLESKPVNNVMLAGTPDKGNSDGGASTPGGTQAKDDNSCESKGPLGWIMCPVINATSEALYWFDTQIKENLETEQPTDQIQASWSRVRNFALILLVPIMLVMVISTALGFDFIDAYTVKRALPRLAIAIILISLSYPLAEFAINIFNIIGRGVQGIMLSPWPGASSKTLAGYISPGQMAVIVAATTGALTLGFGVLFPLLLAGALGLLMAFVVLGIRRVILMLLIILAPLAIVAWILPGTEKFWKLWWSNFTKLLFMFPLIMALLAAGKIGAEMLGEVKTGVNFFLVMVALIVPYFLITTTFKAGGALFGALSGAAMGSVSGARKYLRGRSGAALKQRGQDLRNANYFKGGKKTGFRASLNKGLQGASYAGRAGINPTKWKGNIGRAVELNAKQQRDAMLEDEEYADWKMNDTLNKEGAAAKNSGDLRRRLQALQASGAYTGNIDRDVARYERISRKYGNTAFRQRSVLQAIAGGTAYGSSVEALEALAQAGGGDRASEADMISEARKSAMNAGRIDQGGNSFGKTIANVQAIQQLQAQRASDAIDDAGYQAGLEQIRQKQNREVLEAQGPDVITHSSVKTSAMKELIPQFKERLKEAYYSGDESKIKRELAIAASVYDGLSRSNPEKAREFGDSVMAWDPLSDSPQDPQLPMGATGPVRPNDGMGTLLTRIEAVRGDEQFRLTRREYDSRIAAEGTTRPPSEPGGPAVPPMGGGIPT